MRYFSFKTKQISSGSHIPIVDPNKLLETKPDFIIILLGI